MGPETPNLRPYTPPLPSYKLKKKLLIICPSSWLVGEFASSLRLLRSEMTVLGAPVPCPGEVPEE